MNLKQHQIEAVNKSSPLLQKNNFVYIFGEPRIGKSLIALEIFKDKNPLVITKKGALNDWQKYQNYYNFSCINYESIAKLSPKTYNAIIIDESHNLSALPKPSQRIKNIKTFCRDKPIVFLSGTPIIETPLSIYPQLSVSSFSPFNKYRNFYEFFREWGISEKVYYYGHLAETYKKHKPELLSFIEPYIVKVNYKDAGITYKNSDKIINIPVDDKYYKIVDKIKKGILEDLVFENSPSINMALHQFEGGTIKNRVIKYMPKFEWLKDYIKQYPKQKIAVMSYFIKEQEYLSNNLPQNCKVFSSTKYCEGVDLSDFDIYILYSFGYSGAKFTQLRDRIVNIAKDKQTYVIIPLIEKSIGQDIYNVVSQKRNFNLKVIYE